MLAFLHSMLANGGWLAVPAAFIGGVVAGLNPCCVTMYPAAAATCCVVREEQKRSLPTSLALVTGVAVAMAVLGVVAALLGRVMTGLSGWMAYALALVPLAAGMYVIGWIRIPRLRAPTMQLRTGGAFLAGLLLSLAIAPCGTPILASILSYTAYRGSLPFAAMLLFAYGIGVGVPVLLLGVTAAKLAVRLDRSGLRSWVDRAAGSLLIGTGFYLLWMA